MSRTSCLASILGSALWVPILAAQVQGQLPKHVQDAIAEPILRAGIRENMQTAWEAYKAVASPKDRGRIGRYLIAANEALREVHAGMYLEKGGWRTVSADDARREAPDVIFRPYNYRKSAKWNRENREYKVIRWDDPNAVHAGALVRVSLSDVRVTRQASEASIFYIVEPKDGAKALLIQMPANRQLPDDSFSLTLLAEVVQVEKRFPGYTFDRALSPLRIRVEYYTGEMTRPVTFGTVNARTGESLSPRRRVIPIRQTKTATLLFVEH